MTIDEAISKIGSFSRQDAIDLVSSSQGVPSWTGEPGHPLEHCEVTYTAWPMVRFHGSPNVGLSGLGAGSGRAIVTRPERLALDLEKGRHSLSWTDEHLLVALRDLFLGKGAFMALHHLKGAGIASRLVFKKPGSHSTIATVSKSSKAGGVRTEEPPTDSVTRTYKAVLDHCVGGRLHLQTIFAEPDNSQNVEILVRQGNTVVFQTMFPYFEL